MQMAFFAIDVSVHSLRAGHVLVRAEEVAGCGGQSDEEGEGGGKLHDGWLMVAICWSSCCQWQRCVAWMMLLLVDLPMVTSKVKPLEGLIYLDLIA